MMNEGKTRAIKTLVIFAGVLVYIAGVLYAEVHGYSMLVNGIDPAMFLWAVLGMVALGITALTLPLALHYWTHQPMHRLAALGFYAVDLGLLALNAVTDFANQTGEALPQWQQFYMSYGVPTTPVIAALGWAILFLLDPSQKMRAMAETLKASTQEVLSNRIAEAAKSADISAAIESAAQAMAADIVKASLGAAVQRSQPAPAQPLLAWLPTEKAREYQAVVDLPKVKPQPEVTQ